MTTVDIITDVKSEQVSILTAAAQSYIERGWHVFPLHTPIFKDGEVSCDCHKPNCGNPPEQKDDCGKHPRTLNGKDDASNDPAKIAKWWSMWPQANIGIACAPSGLLALDFDPDKAGYAGGPLQAQLRKEYPTKEVKTGGGGSHFYYLRPDDLQPRDLKGTLPKGIDVRGAGYVVAPGSLHKSGNLYEWANNLDPQPLPDFIAAILRKAQATSAAVVHKNGNSAPAPDVRALTIPPWTLDKIEFGHNKPDESGQDFGVMKDLYKAGCTGDQALAIYNDYPVGQNGKMSRPGQGEKYFWNTWNRATEAVESERQELNSAPYLLNEGIHDEGNAQCVNKRYEGAFGHNGAFGWMNYTGTHWSSKGGEEAVDRAITETLIARAEAGLRSDDPRKFKDLINKSIPNAGKVAGAKSQLTSLVYVDDETFDANPDLLNCQNGVVNLRTGKITAHSRENRFTYCIPVDYDPNAVGVDFWVNWLTNMVTGGSQTVDWLQMAVGYTLTGHTREEILFYVFGRTRSGKGTFTESLMKMLGKPLSAEINFSTLIAKREGDTQNFDLAPLKPCRAIFASETNEYERFNEAKVKVLTGGNEVRCAFKHKDSFNYRPMYKIWLSSNHPINANPDDDAVWGRMAVLEFPHCFLGKEDKSLKQKMKSPNMQKAILAWAVAGAMRWYALGSAGLPELPQGAALKDAQRAQLDNVQIWLEERCLVGGDGFTPNWLLYSSYGSWCTLNGVEPKKQKSFSQTLDRKGYKSGVSWVEGKQYRGFFGIGLDKRS